MLTLRCLLVMLLISGSISAQTRYWVATTTANWSGNNWSSTSGGAPDGLGAPTGAQDARFNANGTGNCNVDAAVTIDGIEIQSGYTGTIDLNGFSFVSSGSGNVDFGDGNFNDTPGTSQLTVSTTGYARFQGTQFGAVCNILADRIILSGSIFNAAFTGEQNGTNSAAGNGGNTFNALTSLTNSGTSELRLGNTNPDIFNADVSFNNTGTGYIRVANNSVGNQFNENIILDCTNGLGIRFGDGGSSTSILAPGKTITIGTAFTDGNLTLRNFNQVGNTPQNLTATGTTLLYLYDASFSGKVDFASPRINIRGTSYADSVRLEKTGANNDGSDGGNTFAAYAELVNSGTGYFLMGNSTPDDFQDNVSLYNTGSDNMYLAHNSLGNTVSGDLFVEMSGTSQRIYIGTGTVSSLDILGSVTINSMSTSANSYIHFPYNGDVTVGGDVDVTVSSNGANSSAVYLSDQGDGSIDITGNLTCISNGSTNSINVYAGDGGDITVHGDLYMDNSGTGSNSQMIFANGTNCVAIVDGNATFVNNNTAGNVARVYVGNSGTFTIGGNLSISNAASAANSQVYCSHAGAGTLNGNVTVELTNATADGIYFGNNNGTTQLASGQTFSVGSGGYIAGQLYLRNVTQVGSTPLTLSLTGTARIQLYESDWGGAVDFQSPRIITRGCTYHDTTYLTKTGATDDVSDGGNTFMSYTKLTNTGPNYFMMGNSTGDVFLDNLDILNNGSDNIYLANNSTGNAVAGNISIQNTGNARNVILCNGNGSDLVVSGNIDYTNTSSNAYTSSYIGNNGTLTINGDLIIDQSPTGDVGYVYVANGTNSVVTIGGNTTVVSNGSGANTHRIYLGNQGDVVFTGTLDISNNSVANNSEVYLNDGSNSFNTYNGDITIEATPAGGDGIRFGQSGGSGTLAATKTISIGAGGFVDGQLRFQNFTQVGNTSQTLITSDPTLFYNYDSDWGGDVVFEGGSMITRGTTYHGTAYLGKTGTGGDQSVGGNVFMGNAQLVHSGPGGYFMMANGNPDDFQANLDLNNTGDGSIYIAYNSAGNTIAGDLTAVNSGNADQINISSAAASTVDIGGNVSLTDNSVSSGSAFYLGSSGDVTVGGDLTATNVSSGASSNFYIANAAGSDVFVNGSAVVVNAGTGATTHRIYVGNNGNITLNGTLDISNSATATNSEVFCNYSGVGVYNDNIMVKTTAAGSDGIRFGQGNGSSTLAATRTITINAGGFVSGDLYFRNFIQVGATAQTLSLTGDSRMVNYDSDWGGDVNFIAPQQYVRGTTFNGASYIEKTGAGNDDSPGGNTFVGNSQIVNTGSGYFRLANGTADVFASDLDVLNSGSDGIYIAYNSSGNSVGGNLTVTNSGSGTYVVLSGTSASDLFIAGMADVVNTSSAASSNLYLGDQGDITFNSTLDIANTPSAAATNGTIRLGNNTNNLTTVAGNCTAVNNGSAQNTSLYLGNSGSVDFQGDLHVTNTATGSNSYVYVANNTSSAVQVAGTADMINTGPGSNARFYVGYYGNVTFNGQLNMSNSSSATNSEISANRNGGSSNQYNGNIVLECTNASCDGIYFGDGNGTGVLAAGRTATIGAGGFIAGTLYFRNFTQTGATAQTLTTTGDARIYNYSSEWNGDVDFHGYSMLTTYSTYNGAALFEKTGAVNDNSTGGNTFNGNTEIRNSGTGYFMPSNNVPNDYNADASFVQSSTGVIYPSYNCASTFAGDLNINYSSGQIYFGAAGNGRIILDGTGAQSVNNLAASNIPLVRDLQVVNTGAGVTLNMPVTITVELDLDQGVVFTDATNLLYMNDNTTVSSVSDASHVDGPLEKIGNDAFVFPVGNAGVYQPIAMSPPSSGSARFRGRYFNMNSAPTYDDSQIQSGIHHVSDCEYWLLDRISSTSNVTVTLAYKPHTGACSGVTDPATLRVAGWNGSMWLNLGNGGTTGSSTVGTISTTGQATFYGPFTLANTTDYSTNPLPVELLSWEATPVAGHVALNWQTATETNNDYFIVRVSNDGEVFNDLMYVNGAGNSSSLTEYKEFDYEPVSGMNYYRLIQVDFDGTRTDHGIRKAEFNAGSSNDLRVYPNPSLNGTATVEFDDFVWNGILDILDVSGKTVHSESFNGQRINLNGQLKSGTYIIRITDGDKVMLSRFIVR